MRNTPKQEYSGRFVLRIASDLHESLARRAAERHVSLNQYVQNLLARHLGGVETGEYALMHALGAHRTAMAELFEDKVRQAARAGIGFDKHSQEQRS